MPPTKKSFPVRFGDFVMKIAIKLFNPLLGWMLKRNLRASVLNALFISTVAVLLSLYSSRINESSISFLEVFFHFSKWFTRTPDILVIVYWILQIFSIIWVTLFLYSQSKIEEQKVRDNKGFITSATNQIQAAIHTAPNPLVFLNALTLSFSTDEFLKKLKAKIDAKTATKNDYKETVKMFLEVVFTITQSFNPLNNASYCVNIMPYVKGSDRTIEIKDMVAKDEVLLFKSADFSDYFIRGLLIGREDLRHEENRETPSPLVNLPIFTQKDDKKTKKPYLLPGACAALVKHQNVVHSTDLATKNDDFDKVMPIAFGEKLKEFFEGSGKDIKSIVSFLIPRPNYPLVRDNQLEFEDDLDHNVLGVLNIDCSIENILGNNKAYYITYYSIIWPIIFNLAPYLETYLNYDNIKPARRRT